MNEFGEFSHIFDYVPFGVDTEFWHTDENVERGNFALFIGNDANREFEFLVELARSAKDIQFKAVTKRIADKDLPGNFELMQGDWHKELISDRDIRRLYQSAGCCVLPYRETLQPTGQTVALQAMACGCPVIMTPISGLWDYEELKDEENVLLAKNDTDEWIGKINMLLSDRDFARHIAKNAKTTLNKYWSYKTFSKSFMDRIALLQNS
jgi:glycosyltransferase involved in cell wall biosynthesis